MGKFLQTGREAGTVMAFVGFHLSSSFLCAMFPIHKTGERGAKSCNFTTWRCFYKPAEDCRTLWEGCIFAGKVSSGVAGYFCCVLCRPLLYRRR
jgi:hypothetical protein